MRTQPKLREGGPEIYLADCSFIGPICKPKQHLWRESYFERWLLLSLQNFTIFMEMSLSLEVLVSESTFFSRVEI